MNIDHPFWARRIRNSKGNNNIKKIIGVRNGHFLYVNEGYTTVEEGHRIDFEIEYGCNAFDDDAVEFRTTDFCQLCLHSGSVYFELEGTPRTLRASWFDDTETGLTGRRVLIAAPYQDQDSSFREEIATVRVERQFLINRNHENQVERWGFCCSVCHYYESHKFSLDREQSQ